MKIKGRIMRLRDVDGGANFEMSGIAGAFDVTEEHLRLIIKRKDLCHGDDLRFELKILDDDDAG
jgi:hypothetical protein